jgi:predicted acyl esterase
MPHKDKSIIHKGKVIINKYFTHYFYFRTSLGFLILAVLFSGLFFSETIRAQGGVDLSYLPISIPMRDGQSLAADLYYADASPQAKPVILIQTPYNKDFYRTGDVPGQGGGKKFPVDSHYNYVVVDWRGFYGSQGADVPGYDRGLDGYDCVQWIASEPWCAGKVGTWGPSALGYIQYLTAKYQPPQLVCCTIQVKDFKTLYENYYYGGDFRKEHVQSLALLGLVDLAVILAHPTFDAVWQTLEETSDIADRIKVPVLIVGGWYDHFPNDVLRSFEDLRLKSDPSVREKHKLIFGPWTHSGVGSAQQGVLEYSNATDIYSTEIQFWDHYLRGLDNGWDQMPVASYYQMGENAWHTAGSWPGIPRSNKTLYLQPGGALLETLPPAGVMPDIFRYDPADPTPALGGSRFNPFDPDLLVGPQDLSQIIETRPDVLVYSTPVLEEDLRVNGSMSVRLYVSSDRTDTDFCVRLTDVYPDGRSLIMTQGIRRMRFRSSLSTEELMTPGQVYAAEVDLQDLALTFLAGHRLRIDICSADYPHFDENRNDGGPMYIPGPSYVATNTVYHDPDHPSWLSLAVLPSGPLSGDFSYAPQSPSDGESVTFTATGAGGTPPYSFAWDLDGAAAVGETASHAFSAGSHVVRLDVKDGAGGQASSSKIVTVLPGVSVNGVVALSSPLRLKVSGTSFQSGCQVEIDGKPAPKTAFKGATRVLAQGSGLKSMVPKGVTVQVTVVNPDGGHSSPFPFTR